MSGAPRSDHPPISGVVCPTLPCQWLASALLKMLSLLVSHPNTVPALW